VNDVGEDLSAELESGRNFSTRECTMIPILTQQ